MGVLSFTSIVQTASANRLMISRLHDMLYAE